MAMKQIHRRALSETSTTASDLGTPGEVRYDISGNVYRLVRLNSAATLSDGAAVYFASGTAAASTSDFGVQGNFANATVRPVGFNNQAGDSLATGAYFWCQVAGVGYVLVGEANIASNAYARASTSGVVTAAVSDAEALFCCKMIAAANSTVTGNAFIFCQP